MASSKKKKKNEPSQVIEITRHITGPPRRSPGQVIRMTKADLEAQGLVHKRDFQFVTNRAINRSRTAR